MNTGCLGPNKTTFKIGDTKIIDGKAYRCVSDGKGDSSSKIEEIKSELLLKPRLKLIDE